MLKIKVLGSGCPNCQRLAQLTEHAAQQLGAEFQMEKVTDHTRFLDYGLLSTPGLVLNERLVSSGRVPSEAEITSFLTTALSEA